MIKLTSRRGYDAFWVAYRKDALGRVALKPFSVRTFDENWAYHLALEARCKWAMAESKRMHENVRSRRRSPERS